MYANDNMMTLTEATAAVAASASLSRSTLTPQAQELAVNGAPYVGLRVFGTGAADAYGTIDVYGWYGPGQKGVLLARLEVVLGADSVTTNPLNGTLTGTFYEVDHVRWMMGLTRPALFIRGAGVAPAAGAQSLIVLPTCGALAVTCEVQSLGTATALLVGGRVLYELPEAVLGGAPTAASGSGTITAAGGRAFSWTGDQRQIIIGNLSGGTFYVKLDSTTADTDNWDTFLLTDGQLRITKPTYRLAIFSTVAAVQGTDYTVVGWE